MRAAALIIFLVLCGWAGPATAQEPGVRIGRTLAVGPLGKRRRAAFSPDPIAARIAAGDLSLPKEGDEVELHDGGKQAWHKPAEIKDGGLYKDPALRGGYLSVVVESEIAGVFLRRLKKGWRLETDPSVIYGLGQAFDGDIRRRDLEADTPYNTYTRHGLPPTPIAMPGRSALQAAAVPAAGNAMFFVASGTGGHVFSDTLDDHNAAVRKMLARKP